MDAQVSYLFGGDPAIVKFGINVDQHRRKHSELHGMGVLKFQNVSNEIAAPGRR